MLTWLKSWIRRISRPANPPSDRWLSWISYSVGVNPDGLYFLCRTWWLCQRGRLVWHRIDLTPRPTPWRTTPSDN